jgi:branched-chain amino acid aminotransferase
VFLTCAAFRLFGEGRAAGITAIIASTRQTPPDALDARLKSLNYLPRVLARLEANHAGAGEAIMLNQRGFVAEATVENVFVVRAGVLSTPPPTEGALEGITRAVVLELARAAQIPTREEPLAPYDLHTADEVFLTGTGAELVPVRSVDGRDAASCPGPLFLRLSAAFRALVDRESGG